MKPPPGLKYTQPEGAGNLPTPGNGCFAALALKYTWRGIFAYFQPKYHSMPLNRENTISPLMLGFTSNRFQNDRCGLLIEENQLLYA